MLPEKFCLYRSCSFFFVIAFAVDVQGSKQIDEKLCFDDNFQVNWMRLMRILFLGVRDGKTYFPAESNKHDSSVYQCC